METLILVAEIDSTLADRNQRFLLSICAFSQAPLKTLNLLSNGTQLVLSASGSNSH